MLFGVAELNWELSRVALWVAKVLETHGYRSLPIPPSYTLSRYRYWEELYDTGRCLGDLSIKHTALAAGLGTFGWSNLFLTSEYGARQRLVTIITEAPLEAAELKDMRALCQPKPCGYLCVETRPIGAISMGGAQEYMMNAHAFRYAVLDQSRCRWCLDGFTRGSGSRTHFARRGMSRRPTWNGPISMKKRYWGRHLWARDYFCASVGAVAQEQIKEYIEKYEQEPPDEHFSIDGEFRS